VLVPTSWIIGLLWQCVLSVLLGLGHGVHASIRKSYSSQYKFHVVGLYRESFPEATHMHNGSFRSRGQLHWPCVVFGSSVPLMIRCDKSGIESIISV
jgi:hypothetical protein